jgi:hypothetical protein
MHAEFKAKDKVLVRGKVGYVVKKKVDGRYLVKLSKKPLIIVPAAELLLIPPKATRDQIRALKGILK